MSLRRISDIHDTPVLDLESGEMLGQIIDWIVNPEQQKIAAYLLTQPTLWRRAQVIVPADIVEYGPRMVVVRDSQVVIEPEELVGLPELLQNKINLLSLRAETESGKVLGTISDFTFTIIDARIYQYYVKPPMADSTRQGEWIVPASQVVRVEPQRIIFSDKMMAGITLATEPYVQTS